MDRNLALEVVRVTEAGIRTAGARYEFDVIIYATGFEAVTGSFNRIDIRGIALLAALIATAMFGITYLGGG